MHFLWVCYLSPLSAESVFKTKQRKTLTILTRNRDGFSGVDIQEPRQEGGKTQDSYQVTETTEATGISEGASPGATDSKQRN